VSADATDLSMLVQIVTISAPELCPRSEEIGNHDRLHDRGWASDDDGWDWL